MQTCTNIEQLKANNLKVLASPKKEARVKDTISDENVFHAVISQLLGKLHMSVSKDIPVLQTVPQASGLVNFVMDSPTAFDNILACGKTLTYVPFNFSKMVEFKMKDELAELINGDISPVLLCKPEIKLGSTVSHCETDKVFSETFNGTVGGQQLEQYVEEYVPSDEPVSHYIDVPDMLRQMQFGEVNCNLSHVHSLGESSPYPSSSKTNLQEELYVPEFPVDLELETGQTHPNENVDVLLPTTERVGNENVVERIEISHKIKEKNGLVVDDMEIAMPSYLMKVQTESNVRESKPQISMENALRVAEIISEDLYLDSPKSLEFKLDPPGLGKITVVVSSKGEEVWVKFLATSHSSHQVLVNSELTLAQTLSEKGLILSGLFVDHDMAGQSGQTDAHSDFKKNSKYGKPEIAIHDEMQKLVDIGDMFTNSSVLDYRV